MDSLRWMAPSSLQFLSIKQISFGIFYEFVQRKLLTRPENLEFQLINSLLHLICVNLLPWRLRTAVCSDIIIACFPMLVLCFGAVIYMLCFIMCCQLVYHIYPYDKVFITNLFSEQLQNPQTIFFVEQQTDRKHKLSCTGTN